jgi:hypothetical protein
MWEGERCYVLGGGPSLKLVDVGRLETRHVIAVNNAYELAPWIPVCFFGDLRWHNWHRAALAQFPGLKVTCRNELFGRPGVLVVRKRRGPYGLSTDQSEIAWNLSSGACAINLATLLGASEIVLLGFDMRKIDGKTNWHDEHPGEANAKRDPYARFLEPFTAIARDLEAMSVPCVNATPGSALTLFPIVDPESVT